MLLGSAKSNYVTGNPPWPGGASVVVCCLREWKEVSTVKRLRDDMYDIMQETDKRE